MAEPVVSPTVVDQFSDWRWRLSNLYWITDKDGRKTPFRMNWAQEALFDQMHFLNVILKARQLGFTTFIQLFMLDACVFNSNIRAGTIAHTLGDAVSIFRDKVRFPYENLPDGIRQARPVTTDSATELMLANNSSIRVGTSLRSGTLQYLHISEYGKLCARFPEKAREVRTGALNTVQAGQLAFIESTAEGQEGHYYEICQSAQAKARMGTSLSPLDFKFHFFPWHKSPDYVLDAVVAISDDLRRYFTKLEETAGIVLSDAQRAWYAKKCETQLADMKREFPSTPEEAFEASIEGAYYGELIAAAEHQHRVGDFPAVAGIPVHTAWDIGRRDYTAIWFFQVVLGRPRVVAYFQNEGEAMPYYIGTLKTMALTRGWVFGTHWLPHDGRVVEWGTGRSRIEQMLDGGFQAQIQPGLSLEDGINAVRTTIPLCVFDEAGTFEGMKSLKAYRKDWDEEHGIWLNRPCHNWASHGADAFRGLALSWHDVPSEVVMTPAQSSAAMMAAIIKPPTIDEMIDMAALDDGDY